MSDSGNTPAPTGTTTVSRGDAAFVEVVSERIRNSGVYVGTGGLIAKALLATSLQEATDTPDLLRAEDHLGERMRFLGCTFADSDPNLAGALPFYAQIDVIRGDTGTRETMSCGGARVVATLLRATEMDWFPFDASIVSVALGGGKDALNIVLAPAKVENTKK